MDKKIEPEKLKELFNKHDIENKGKINFETFLKLFNEINLEYGTSLDKDFEENFSKYSNDQINKNKDFEGILEFKQKNL